MGPPGQGADGAWVMKVSPRVRFPATWDVACQRKMVLAGNTSARQPKSDCSLAVGEQVGRSPRGAGCPVSCRQGTNTECSKPATREDPPRRMAGGDKARPQRTRESKAQYRADDRET